MEQPYLARRRPTPRNGSSNHTVAASGRTFDEDLEADGDELLERIRRISIGTSDLKSALRSTSELARSSHVAAKQYAAIASSIPPLKNGISHSNREPGLEIVSGSSKTQFSGGRLKDEVWPIITNAEVQERKPSLDAKSPRFGSSPIGGGRQSSSSALSPRSIERSLDRDVVGRSFESQDPRDAGGQPLYASQIAPDRDSPNRSPTNGNFYQSKGAQTGRSAGVSRESGRLQILDSEASSEASASDYLVQKTATVRTKNRIEEGDNQGGESEVRSTHVDVTPESYFRARSNPLSEWPSINTSSTDDPVLFLTCPAQEIACKRFRVHNASRFKVDAVVEISPDLRMPANSCFFVFPSRVLIEANGSCTLELVYVAASEPEIFTTVVSFKGRKDKFFQEFTATCRTVEARPQSRSWEPVKHSQLVACSSKVIDFGDAVDSDTGSSLDFRLKSLHPDENIVLVIDIAEESIRNRFKVRITSVSDHLLGPGREATVVIELQPGVNDPCSCEYTCLVRVNTTTESGSVHSCASIRARGSTCGKVSSLTA